MDIDKEIERLEKFKAKMTTGCWLTSQMRLNLERAYATKEERERIIKIIKSLDCSETFCWDCESGFDEDSDECFRCNGNNVDHRDIDISKESLIIEIGGDDVREM